MFVIRDEQRQALNAGKRNRFLNNQIKNLQKKFPSKVSGETDNALKTEVDLIINYGLKHQIALEVDLENLINICFNYDFLGTELASSEMAKEIFSFPDRDPDDKIFHLFNELEQNKRKRI